MNSAPEPPYFAVIFTSIHTEADTAYELMAEKMAAAARKQPGFIGLESVRNAAGLGITVSYWKDQKSISDWKQHAEHSIAQSLGRAKWYSDYTVRICRVEKTYGKH